MDSDKTAGLIMSIGGTLLILILFIIQILIPQINSTILSQMPESQYWAMAIPGFLFTSFGLGTVAWIGFTMYKTPPPEIKEFEDFKVADVKEKKSTTSKKKPDKKKSETKKKAPAKAKKEEKPVKKTEAKKSETKKKVEEKPKEKPKTEPKAESKEEPKKEVKEEPKAVASSYELTDIKGVGASSADNLREAGFDTVEKIANATIKDLTKVSGVGKATATKYIDRAKELLNQ